MSLFIKEKGLKHNVANFNEKKISLTCVLMEDDILDMYINVDRRTFTHYHLDHVCFPESSETTF
jgi:hypothetical protein